MKKILIATTIVFTTGVLSLLTRVNHVKPVSAIQIAFFDCKKELASGD